MEKTPLGDSEREYRKEEGKREIYRRRDGFRESGGRMPTATNNRCLARNSAALGTCNEPTSVLI